MSSILDREAERNPRPRQRGWLVCLAGLVLAANALADEPVGITARQPWLDVKHDGRTVRIEREQDNFNQIAPDFAMTSRPCPPYCIQPMQLAPGIETIGELEVLDYLKRASGGDGSVLLIDSRDPEWLQRSGIIPGAMHLPWTRLHPRHADADAIADVLTLQFGASRSGVLWNFEHAKTLVFYCNGPWCGQSPTNIKQLLALGYPADKLKWYRGGMQVWKSLGLTTVAWGKAAAGK
ncbi:MAG: rhodanese-like domain-containing protein [Burkholderiaceae bacterium]|nr:rhodanese-like domain-containing protein [Sulfuritalea sp.]MCF8173857.1 rhodanese-like domain-containing protein [Burkholderiaceae bacterium]MCF8184069.1 rhodanese-like domain-containing protein [Polynucleobacter sp.]